MKFGDIYADASHEEIDDYDLNDDEYQEDTYGDDALKYVQFEGRGNDGASYRLKYQGAQHDIIVRTPYEHSLSHHMREPEKKGECIYSYSNINAHTYLNVQMLCYSSRCIILYFSGRLFQVFTLPHAWHFD